MLPKAAAYPKATKWLVTKTYRKVEKERRESQNHFARSRAKQGRKKGRQERLD